MPSAYRLDPTLRPTRYLLDLWCDVDAPGFRGRVQITLHAAKHLPYIELHAGKTLAVTAAALDGGVVSVGASPHVAAAEEVLRVNAACGPGDHTLTLEFDGQYNTAAHGIYVSLWRGSRTLVTQFEATSARLAFPCFDEPAFKAVFEIVIHSVLPPPIDGVVPWQVLSNMPLATTTTTTPGDGAVFRFQPTPVMSTYILAFVIAPLVKGPSDEKDEGDEEARTPQVTVWAYPGDAHLTTLPQDFARRALGVLATLFKCPFDLPKLDLVPVFDFDAGAMENWGLVTFRASHLLVDEVTGSNETKAAMMDIVAHELAHQWFGNLVTMAWWDDIWLNESFATFAAAWVTSHVVRDAHAQRNPRYRFLTEHTVWMAFVEREMTTALESDALAASRPVYVDPSFMEKTSDIEQLFDDKAYAKGGVVLRMLFSYIGEDAMCAGLHRYLTAYAYGNATSQQLWDALGSDVAAWVKPWITTPGFPVITVTSSGGFTQARFCALQPGNADGGPSSSSSSTSLWTMPVPQEHNNSLQLARDAAAGPFATTAYINTGFIVPAIVVGEEGDDGVDVFGVPPLDDDATAMCKLVSLRLAAESGLRPVTPRALEFLLQCLSRSDAQFEFSNKLAYDIYKRWTALCTMSHQLVRSACSAIVSRQLATIVRFVKKSLAGRRQRRRHPRNGPPPSACRSATNWSNAAALAVLVESSDARVCDMIKHVVEAFVADPRALPIDVVAVALKEMARHIDKYPTYLTYVQDMYLANQNPQLNPLLVNMMGSINDKAISGDALEWAGANVRPSDMVYLFFRDYEHRSAVRDPWLQRHWASLQSGQGRHGMAYIVKHALIHVKSPEELERWVAFFAAHGTETDTYHMAVEEAVEKARVNIQAVEVLSRQLCACLNDALATTVASSDEGT